MNALVGVELSDTSATALTWMSSLQAQLPCKLIVAQIAWPPDEQKRQAVHAPMPLDHLEPSVQLKAESDLRDWTAKHLHPDSKAQFLVTPGWGRTDSHLTQVATERDIDLLVVGTHQRAAIARLWQGSVSRGVLQNAPMSVLCVPPGSQALLGAHLRCGGRELESLTHCA